MITNFHLYWLCSISSDGAGACTYRTDDTESYLLNPYCDAMARSSKVSSGFWLMVAIFAEINSENTHDE
jgi:hypothetical protein